MTLDLLKTTAQQAIKTLSILNYYMDSEKKIKTQTALSRFTDILTGKLEVIGESRKVVSHMNLAEPIEENRTKRIGEVVPLSSSLRMASGKDRKEIHPLLALNETFKADLIRSPVLARENENQIKKVELPIAGNWKGSMPAQRTLKMIKEEK